MQPTVPPPTLPEKDDLHPAGVPGLERSSRRRRRRLREEQGEDASDKQTLAAGLLCAVVAGSVLAIGALHLPVLLIVAALAFASASVALSRQAQTRAGLALPLPSLVCAGLAAYTLLQAVPLPMSWLSVIAPANADVWQRCLMPFGEAGPHLAPISLDPGASMVEALKWTIYAAVFASASAISARHGAAWGVLMVFGAAAAAAFATLGHGLAGAHNVYGLYQPTFATNGWHVGPLLNPNNLAGYLNLGALCGLGLMLSHRPPLPRWLLGLGVALIVGIEVTAASRGGVIALPIGVAMLGFFTRRRDHKQPLAQSRSAWMLILAVAGGALFAMLGGTAKAWEELYDKNLSKMGMILWVKPLVRDHPWFGIGRGAFESVFPVYRTAPGNVVYTHPENFVAQWISEWGLPVGLAALLVCAWMFTPRRLGATQSAVAAGAWSGVAVLVLQNLVDLALEVPGVTIGLVAVLGALWGDRRMHSAREALRSDGPLSPLRARAVAVAIATLGVGLGIAATAFGAHDVAADRAAARDALDAALKSPSPDVGPVRASLHTWMLRHPAEPYFPLVGALSAHRAHAGNPIPWLQRLLERGKVNGRAHLLLAEVLAAPRTRRQALLELRLALEDDSGLFSAVASLALRWTRDFDDLLTLVPEGREGAKLLARLGAMIHTAELEGRATPEDMVLRSRCDREAIERDATLIEPHVREAEVRIAALQKGAGSPLCGDRAHCRAEILAHVEAITAAEPDAAIAPILRSRLLLAEDKPEEAVKMLEKVCDVVSNRHGCLHARVEAAARVKAPAMLDAASKEFLSTACVTTVQCADTATWLAGLRVERNEGGIALGLLGRAAREDPSNDSRWLKLADVASSIGAHMQAAEALEKVARRHGGADPALKQRIDEERSQALGGLLPGSGPR